MPFSVNLIKKLESVDPSLRDVLIAVLEEVEKHREESVAKAEFLEFARETRENFLKVWEVVEKLAEAQRKTEERVNQLASVQEKAEERLSRVEESLERLAEAQKKTEEKVNQLAEAQRKTEEALRKLVEDHKETRRQLGGLSMTIGYRLEDEAFKALPSLLKRDYGITVEGRLKRTFVKDAKGDMLEVNIVGKGKKNGTELAIIGEAKAQLSKKDVDKFIRRKLKRLEGVFPNMFPILVTYMISQPDVEDYAKKKGIALYYSYEF